MSVHRACIQIVELLERNKILKRLRGKRNLLLYGDEDPNRFSENFSLIKGLLTAGFYPNIGIITRNRMMRLAQSNNSLVHISSVNYLRGPGRAIYAPPANPEPRGTPYIFTSKNMSSDSNLIALRQTSRIDEMCLLLFGGQISHSYRILSLDQWLNYYLPNPPDGLKIVQFRQQLDKFLAYCFSRLGDNVLEDVVSSSEITEAMAQSVSILLESAPSSLSSSPDRYSSYPSPKPKSDLPHDGPKQKPHSSLGRYLYN